ncbi:M48 family metallopeptidase [Hydrogenimonas cancrithermarum]|uniref:Lipoprotein n=1 Tax=Hydrogenimonas cancrithermarum TaxID=2993563 RepID=A0ABM8FHM9_9BACT|nr:M48 family metallopeptidase [Hydrogenimonas cancrithermarum]BDY11778.1 lipoprotein [Hydrogenimonas cancrithermarum]
MKRIFLALLIPILLITGCAKAPVTGRTQLIMLSPQQEMALGFQAEREIFESEKVTNDPRFVEPVQRVGHRIAKATGLDLDWKFYVIENDKVPNAFCLANGHVFVYTGLFKYIDNDAQLATVMAHEIAHAIAHHVAERISVAQLTGIATAIAAEAIHSSANEYQQLYEAALGIGSQVGVMLPYSRMQESEADHIGLILMAEACYDPREALKFWEKFAKANGGEEPIVYFSTHPATKQRIEQLKRLMPRAMEIYKTCDRSRLTPVKSGEPYAASSTLGERVD